MTVEIKETIEHIKNNTIWGVGHRTITMEAYEWLIEVAEFSEELSDINKRFRSGYFEISEIWDKTYAAYKHNQTEYARGKLDGLEIALYKIAKALEEIGMSERPVDELEQLKSAFDELDSAYVDLLEQNTRYREALKRIIKEGKNGEYSHYTAQRALEEKTDE